MLISASGAKNHMTSECTKLIYVIGSCQVDFAVGCEQRLDDETVKNGSCCYIGCLQRTNTFPAQQVCFIGCTVQ